MGTCRFGVEPFGGAWRSPYEEDIYMVVLSGGDIEKYMDLNIRDS